MGTFFIVAAIGTAMFGLAHSFGTIILGRFLMGVGVAVVWIPCMRILANWFRPAEFSTLTGTMLTFGNAGAILASAPLAFLVGLVGWRAAFYWLGGFMLILAGLNFIVLRNKPQDKGFPTVSEIDGIDYYGQKSGQVSFTQNVKKLFGMRNYWLLAIYAFVIYGTVMGFQGLWCIPYLQHTYGLPKQQAANILMFWAIGMGVGCFSIGWASDRILKSRRKASLYGMIIYIVTWLPLVIWPASIPGLDVLSPAFHNGILVRFVRAQLCAHRGRTTPQLYRNRQRDAQHLVFRGRRPVSGRYGPRAGCVRQSRR